MTGPAVVERQAKTPVRSDLLGPLAVVVAAALWGTSGVFVKLLGIEAEISALALAFWRDITSFAVLAAGVGLFRPDWLRIRRRDLRWLLGLGASLGVFHIFWNLAVFLSGAAVATVQQAAMPVIVAVAARLIWREPLTRSKAIAILLTFAGTVLVSGPDVLSSQGAKPSLGGLLVGLAVPVTYASWNLFGKKVRETYNPFTTLTYAFGFGALVLLPVQFFTPQPWPAPPSALLYFAGLLAVATLIPFCIYTLALGGLPASVATILAMSEIVFVAAYAYLLLGERLTASQIVGAVLVVGGVLLLPLSRWQDRGHQQQKTRHKAV